MRWDECANEMEWFIMGNTFAEKVLAKRSGNDKVVPGQIVMIKPDHLLMHDNAAAINQGLVLIKCSEAVQAYKEGDEVSMDIDAGKIVIAGQAFNFPLLPPEILAIRDAGGLLAYMRGKLGES